MTTPQRRARPQPVIVTRREVERILVQKEAAAQIEEVAAAGSDLERAAAMAMTGAILRELRAAEEDAGTDRVMVTAQHGPASMLQALIASGEHGILSTAPMETGGLEAKFDTGDWIGWSKVVWEKLRSGRPHPLLRPRHVGPQALPDRARIALVGDWGTGLYGAPRIAEAIEADPDPFEMLVHLGDVYYSGTAKEIQERFLDLWPQRPGAVHRAVNANHEMYSGGHAYFGALLPAFDQDASYFAHQNARWTIIGLDVAHLDHAIDDEQVRWLEGILAQAGDRRVVLLSHHQPFSTFESGGEKLWGHPRFGAILRSRRIFAWYWGHEHRCVVYEQPHPEAGLWGRCVGHGGMPESRRRTRDLDEAPHERLADWRAAPARTADGGKRVVAPPALVLEGPNPLIPGEEEKFTPHGYAVLSLDGPRLVEQVRDADGAVILERTFD